MDKLFIHPQVKYISAAAISAIGAGAASAISAGGAIANNSLNAGQTKRQRQWQHDEATLAYERNMNAWNLNNQYNSPKEQMARLRQAGLNPNLALGQPVSAVAPQAQQASGSNPIPYQNPFDVEGLSSLISSLSSAIKGDSEIAEIQERILSYKPQRDQILAQNKQIEATIAKLDEEKRGLFIDNMIKEQIAPSVISKLASQAKISEEQAKITAQYLQLTLVGKMLENANAEKSGKLIDAQKRYYNQMSEQSKKYCKQLDAMTTKLNGDNWSRTLGQQLQEYGEYGWTKGAGLTENIWKNVSEFLGDSFQFMEYFAKSAGNVLGSLFK